MTLKRGVTVQIALQISGTVRVNDVGQTLHHQEVKSDGKHKARTTPRDGNEKRIFSKALVSFMHHNASNLGPECHQSPRTLESYSSFVSRVKRDKIS